MTDSGLPGVPCSAAELSRLYAADQCPRVYPTTPEPGFVQVLVACATVDGVAVLRMARITEDSTVPRYGENMRGIYLHVPETEAQALGV